MKSVFTDVKRMNDYINFRSQKEINILRDKYPKRSLSLFIRVASDIINECIEISSLFIMVLVSTLVFSAFMPISVVKIPLISCGLIVFVFFMMVFIKLLAMDYNLFIKNIAIKKMSAEVLTIEDLKDIKYYVSQEMLDFFMKDMASGRKIYWGALLDLHQEETEHFTKMNRLKNIQDQVL